MQQKKHRLILIAGPSGVGKTPLLKSFAKMYPDEYRTLKTLLLYSSRSPRPGEIDGKDYYFRTEEYIHSLTDREHFIALPVRGHLQGVDVKELIDMLNESDVIYEGNTFTAVELIRHKLLEQNDILSVFLSPLSAAEIRFYQESGTNVDLELLCSDIIRRKILRRTVTHKGILSLPDLENIEQRASTVYNELRAAREFSYVIPNHDGEDSEHWDAFYYPIGDAKKTLETFMQLYRGDNAPFSESWNLEL